MECVNSSNYYAMKERVLLMDGMDTELGSSNFGKFLEWLDGEDTEWIDRINGIIEGE